MVKKRRYNLLCRISRALDTVGDRWALLILRDLHAGPARYSELLAGLGIATNLLSSRLTELVDDGLVERVEIDGQDHYRLTEVGRRTDRLLWELARFGLLLAPEDDPRPPGNMRPLVVPLRFALESVADRAALAARFEVNGEPFSIRTSARQADVHYGDTFSDEDQPDVTVATSYDALMAVGDGRLTSGAFLADHVEIEGNAAAGAAFLTLLSTGMSTYAEPPSR